MKTPASTILLLMFLPALGHSLSLEQNSLLLRFVDSGNGLCTVTAFPNGEIMVYDTGHWDHDFDCLNGVREVIQEAESLHNASISSISLMILSHSDSDHLAATDEILANWDVEKLIWSPFFHFYKNRSKPGTFVDARDAIAAAVTQGRIREEVNLANRQLVFGTVNQFGAATVTELYGQNRAPRYWPLASTSKKKNAGSTVVRIDYAGRSVLLTGDAVGRKDGAPLSSCTSTERYLVRQSNKRPIDADVLAAAHHGADNASADCFIKGVSPDFVVFSSGQGHQHPKFTTSKRFFDDNGIPKSRIFRTDLGDDEGAPEWFEGRIPGNRDPVGDDDIDVLIRQSGEICVGYRSRAASTRCLQ